MIIKLSLSPHMSMLCPFLVFVLIPWETSPDNLLDPYHSSSQEVRLCSCISSQLFGSFFKFNHPGLPHYLARLFSVLKSLLLTPFTVLSSYVIVHSVHSEVSYIA